MMDKIKPCPFCGLVASACGPREDEKSYHVHCASCDACGPSVGSRRSAILRWNVVAGVVQEVLDSDVLTKQCMALSAEAFTEDT